MGIPNYFYHVLKNHSGIIQKLYLHEIHNLYLDSNSIIYDTIYEFEDPITSNKMIFDKAYEKIMEIIRITKPKHKTFVSFDGVAPMAKLVQQKQRRYKSNLTRSILSKKSDWNTNQITPGTQFMRELDQYMVNKFKNNKQIIYSGSNEPGEGEHKICNYIRHHYTNKSNITHCIYGLDADLIMLGLLLVKYNHNIVLYRETHHFDYIPKINKDEKYLFILNKMAHQIMKIMNSTNHITAINEYILLCFLCGNDFLPHFSSINIRNQGIHYLIDNYDPNYRLVRKDNTLSWANIQRLFYVLSQHEKEKIIETVQWKHECEKRIRINNKEEKLNALPMRDMSKDIYIMNNINAYTDIVFDGENISNVCKNYLEMFEWTWWYYHGLVKDHYLYYEFGHAPLFYDLKMHTPIHDGENVCMIKINQPLINSMTQLLYVLPVEDHKDHFDSDILDKIYKIFPELKIPSMEIDYTFCKYFWECHVDLYHVQFPSLNNYINSLEEYQ
jgi:5'-3' exonuclease